MNFRITAVGEGGREERRRKRRGEKGRLCREKRGRGEMELMR